MPPHFWLWTSVLLTAFIVGYFRIAQGKLEEQKGRVMAKQRAIAQALGPKLLPFRDRVEGWVQELAKNYPGDFVAPGMTWREVAESPGVYLRLRSANAKDSASIRKAAARSLHDGFTSCFFVRKGEGDPSLGPPCTNSSDCEAGLLCNEFDVCRRPPRPYNMRLLYRSIRVLSPEWTEELHEATSELAVTAYDRDLDAVTNRDVPVAAEILAHAEYFTLVLDEEPESGLPKAMPDAGETDEERVQRVAHPAKISIWSLKSGQPVLRLRAKASAKLVQMGEGRVREQQTRAAQARQANSCALALEARAAFRPEPDGGASKKEPTTEEGTGINPESK
jgi:hypothetical protein